MKNIISRKTVRTAVEGTERKISTFPEKHHPTNQPLYSQQRIYSPRRKHRRFLQATKSEQRKCKILRVHQNANCPRQPIGCLRKRSGNAKIIQVADSICRQRPGKRVYNPEGLAPTLDTMQGTPPTKIVTCDISRRVYIRKHKADLTKLQQLLQESRKNVCFRTAKLLMLCGNQLRRSNAVPFG